MRVIGRTMCDAKATVGELQDLCRLFPHYSRKKPGYPGWNATFLQPQTAAPALYVVSLLTEYFLPRLGPAPAGFSFFGGGLYATLSGQQKRPAEAGRLGDQIASTGSRI